MPPENSESFVRRQLPQRIIPAEIRRQALLLFEQGISYRRVAAELGLSKHTVRDWHRLFKNGSFRIEVSRILECYDDATKQQAVALRKSGVDWKTFEEITCIPRATCMKWLKQE